jgi:hypothetical protein
VPFSSYVPHNPSFIQFDDKKVIKNPDAELMSKTSPEDQIPSDNNVSSSRNVLSASEVKRLLDYSAGRIATNPALPTKPFYGDDNSY